MVLFTNVYHRGWEISMIRAIRVILAFQAQTVERLVWALEIPVGSAVKVIARINYY